MRADQRAAQEARRAERAQAGKSCDVIGQWLTDPAGMPEEVLALRFGGGERLEPSAPARRISYEAWLFQDERAISALGLRFDEVPAAERPRLMQMGKGCGFPRNARGQSIADPMLFFRAFSERYFPGYAKEVVTIREAHAEIAAARSDLPALASGEAGIARYREHAAKMGRLKAYLADTERKAYQQAFHAAYDGVVQGFHAQRIRAAMPGAQGLEGILALAALQAEMHRDADMVGASASVPPELRARQTALARGVVEGERRRIDDLGTGLAGLERGVRWHAETPLRKEGRLAGSVPELRDVLGYFEDKRGQTLEAAEPELSRRIRQARNESELQQLVDRYVPLDVDRQGRGGTALTTALAAQRDELHKRSVIGAVPAANSEPLGKPDLRTTSSSKGEPSESDMYDAFNAQIEQINAEGRRTAERCNNRDFKQGQGDPLLAMQCLQYSMSVGVTNGGQGVMAPQFKVSRFEKIACEKAQGAAGYRCDYVAGFAGNLNMPPSLGAMTSRGSAMQARFVNQGNRWLLLRDQ